MNSYGAEISRPPSGYTAKLVERLLTFIFKYRPLGILKIFHIQTFLTHNYSIRNASVLDAATPPTSETSSGKQKDIKVEKDVESGLESDDEESIRERALLVCFTFHVVNY